jgi:hypothetical protein
MRFLREKVEISEIKYIFHTKLAFIFDLLCFLA